MSFGMDSALCVRPTDLPTLLVSTLLLVAGALAAADLTARKAARVSPMKALRPMEALRNE
jgi:hypothetical protein